MGAGFHIGEWLIQPQLNRIFGPERRICLQPKVMDVLVHLAKHSGEVLSKDRLIQAVWPNTFVTDDVLIHAVWELRKVLEDDARNPRFIETIPRRGYRLMVPAIFEYPAPGEIHEQTHSRAGKPDLKVQDRSVGGNDSADGPRDLLRNMNRLEDELGTILDFIRAFAGALKASLNAKESAVPQSNNENASEGRSGRNQGSARRNSG